MAGSRPISALKLGHYIWKKLSIHTPNQPSAMIYIKKMMEMKKEWKGSPNLSQEFTEISECTKGETSPGLSPHACDLWLHRPLCQLSAWGKQHLYVVGLYASSDILNTKLKLNWSWSLLLCVEGNLNLERRLKKSSSDYTHCFDTIKSTKDNGTQRK